MNVNLRQAKPEDKNDIKKIADFLYLDIPEFVWNTEQFIEQQIKRGECFVAEVDGKITGFVGFRQRRKKFYIENIAIEKNYQCEGIGSRLIDFAKKLTREKGLKVLLACSFYEYNAADFYLNNGFAMIRKPGTYNGHKYYCFEAKID